MITWIGFVGNLTTFILNKVIAKKLDISLDEKKLVCRKFYNLYSSVEELELLTVEFLEQIKPIVKNEKTRIYSNWINGISPKLQTVSDDFIRYVTELEPILNIYDPKLKVMLFKFFSLKALIPILPYNRTDAFDKLYFKIGYKGAGVDSIDFTIPSEDLSETNFEDVYSIMLNDIKSKDKPEKLLDYMAFLIDGNFEVKSLKPTETEKIKTLYMYLKKHLKNLVVAREMLRVFLKKNFTIDDMLHI